MEGEDVLFFFFVVVIVFLDVAVVFGVQLQRRDGKGAVTGGIGADSGGRRGGRVNLVAQVMDGGREVD